MPFPWALAAAELMSVLGAAVGGGKKDPNTEYTAQEEELVNMQVESARRLLDLMKNRIGNENLYMPQALSAVFQNANNQLNAPRNVVWGKHVFEPHLRPRDKVNFTIPTGNWDTKPNDPYPTDPPVPGVPGPPGTGGGGGTNPGQDSPGGGTGPANMPPGLGWVSPGTVRTDDPASSLYNPGLGALMFGAQKPQTDLVNSVYNPGLQGLMAGAQKPQTDLVNSVYNPGLQGLMAGAQLPKTDVVSHSQYNPGGQALMAGAQMPKTDSVAHSSYDPNLQALISSGQMPRTEDAFSSVYNPDLQNLISSAQMPSQQYTNPNAGRPEGGAGLKNVMPGVYTDPNAGRPEGGIGLANHLPNLRTGDEGQGYGTSGYHPYMVGPTFRTGQEGQGYSAANNPTTFRVPDLQAPVTDQGFDDRTFAERQGLSGVHSLGTDTMADPSPAMSAPPEVVQGLTSINALPQAEREDLIGSMGGLPEGLFLMPNGLLSMSGGQGVNGLVSAWLVQAANRMSSPPPSLAPLTGNGATAFNPDPAVRYGVGPDGRNDIGQRKNGKKG